MITEKKLFSDGWSFTEAPLGSDTEAMLSSDEYRPVEIPHDMMIWHVADLYRTCEGWYKKTFTLTPQKGTRYELRFEGVYMNSTVFVNGEAAFEWKYGYSTFDADITRYLHDGENTVAVRVVYNDPNTRWYSGAGIYRRVWLVTSPDTRIAPDGVYIAPKKTDGGWRVYIETDTEGTGAGNYTLSHKIVGADGKALASGDAEPENRDFYLDVKSPRLWNPDDPYLYTLETELLSDGKAVDASSSVFGFRTIKFDPDGGFFINDRHMKLHGVCEHHDLGALGAAMNEAALTRKLKMLVTMGVNSIRTSHNPPATELVELCDRMGIVIIDESFDMWEYHKTAHDYAEFFPEWHERDVKSWVTRDRNHPCVIMWSIGNEIGDTTNERGTEVTRELARLVRLYDRRGNAVTTIASNHMYSETAQRGSGCLDTVGYNYAENLYNEHHRKYPEYCIYGSETSSTVQSRGIYHFPYEQTAVQHEDYQCSSIYNGSTSWGSPSTEYNITSDRNAEFCAGQFIWTGFDYIGEPTPYDTKNSYFGQIDTAGFSKDSYYAYRAEWTDGKKSPMVHITPSYWDFNEGQIIDLTVHSNLASSELYFNGELVGRYVYNHKDGREITPHYKLPYHKGTLTAIAYDEDGCERARDEICSFGDPVRVIISSDKKTLSADGRDIIFADISTVDENGTFVANARCRVNLTLTGAGRLVGLDNGDSTDFEEYKSTSRRLFSGRLLAMIEATEKTGDIVLKASVPGVGEAEAHFTASTADVRKGMDIVGQCENTQPSDEIPLRKIELCTGGGEITPESPLTVTPRLLPSGAIYRDLSWKILLNGMEARGFEISEDGSGNVTIKGAAGAHDGKYTVRASCKNGTPYPSVISEIPVVVSGFGDEKSDGESRAYRTLYAAGADVLYGDKFTRGEREVTGIGNNVTVGFTSLEFTEGASRVTVSGRTRNAVEFVTLNTEGTGRVSRRSISFRFMRTDEYSTVTIPIEIEAGTYSASLIFLPGTDFDLNFIKFEK
ncbi:MAG: DUF4982 domain-containing protein [Clostridiales bacterium]|nr:DUF4982 domain-containing protein [Clostridiales bacterium]